MIQLSRPSCPLSDLSGAPLAHRSSCPFCAAIQQALSRAKCNQRGGTSPMAPLAPLSRTTTRQAGTRHHCRSGRQPLLTAKQASLATMSERSGMSIKSAVAAWCGCSLGMARPRWIYTTRAPVSSCQPSHSLARAALRHALTRHRFGAVHGHRERAMRAE